jgi:hypothetical protein
MNNQVKGLRPYPILTTAVSNFHSWLRSPRTVLMSLFIVGICFLQEGGYQTTLSYMPYDMHWGESCYYVLSTGLGFSITGILFLVMICELPIRTGFHNMSLMRSSRIKWMLSQILYCAWMSLAMVLLLAFFSALFLLPLANGDTGWSETQAILDGYVGESETLVSGYIRIHYTPFTASLLACIPLLLFFFTMALVVFLCTLLGAPTLGVLLYVFLLMAHVILYIEFFPWLALPAYFAILRNVLGVRDEDFRIARMFLIYGVVDSLLVSGLLLRAKKADLLFGRDGGIGK